MSVASRTEIADKFDSYLCMSFRPKLLAMAKESKLPPWQGEKHDGFQKIRWH
jgi:hypothetical protein